MRRGCCPVCEKAAKVCGALSGTDYEPAEDLRVKIGRQINMDVVVGNCCSLPGQETTISRLLEEGTSHSHILVLMRGLNHPSICWKAAQQDTAIQEVSGVHQQQLPNTGDWGPNTEKCSVRPDPCKQGWPGQETEGLGQWKVKCWFKAHTSKNQPVSGIWSPA